MSAQSYRYFLAFYFIPRAGHPSFGNVKIERERPITDVDGPDGTIQLAQDIATAMNCSYLSIISWQRFEDPDVIITVSAGAANG